MSISIIKIYYKLSLVIFIIATIKSLYSMPESIFTADLSQLNFDQIHKLSLINQEESIEPIKSLHTKRTASLNGLYDFCVDKFNVGFKEQWHSNRLKDKCKHEHFYRMPVPSSFNKIASDYLTENFVGWFWYQKTISSDLLKKINFYKDPRETVWFLQFESVNYMAIVYVQLLKPNKEYNATLLGSHIGGYLPFTFNITDTVTKNPAHLKPSDTQFYRFSIAVSNQLNRDSIPSGKVKLRSNNFPVLEPDFDFFHFAGILGDVNLIALGHHYISSAKLDNMNENSVSIWSKREELIELDTNKNHSITTRCYLIDNDDEEEANKVIPDHISAISRDAIRGSKEFYFDFKLKNVKKWNLSNGNSNAFSNMYKIRLETLSFDSDCLKLHIGIKIKDIPSVCILDIIDVYEMKIGFKKAIDFRRQKSIEHPNQQLNGFGMHHEEYFSGRTMSLPAIMKDIYLLKYMGANVIRTSHYPYSSDYLDACDENGIFVVAECQAVGLNSFSDDKLRLHIILLREMIRRDSHRPSIIMWSVANEPESQKSEAAAYFKILMVNMKIENGGYYIPFAAAIAQSHKDDTIGDFLDIIMINRYYGWYDSTGDLDSISIKLNESLVGWATKYPKQALLISEFGADSIVGLHSKPSTIFSEEYQLELLLKYRQVFDEISKNSSINFWGSMIWNFADFSTQPDNSLFRVDGNLKGIFTRSREPKMSVEKIRQLNLANKFEDN